MIAIPGANEWAYDEESHVYSYRGKPQVSVTQACHEGGLSDERLTQFWTDEGRDRGTDIHDALAFYFQYGEQPDLIDEYLPYWEQVMAFLRESGFELEDSEQFVTDPILRYAGRYDFLGQLPRFRVRPYPEVDLSRDLVDVKVNSVPRTVGPQTMAYRRCLKKLPIVRRWALKVTSDHYRLVALNTDANGHVESHKDRQDEQLFISALIVAQFRRSHV